MPLHVVGVGTDNKVYHAIRNRYLHDHWTPWTDVTAIVGGTGSPFTMIACATVDRSVHICGLTEDERILHTFRRPDGVWQSSWGDVGAAAGLGTGQPDGVATAGAGTDLQVFAPIQRRDGKPAPAKGSPVNHAIRSSAPPGWPQSFTPIESGLPFEMNEFLRLAADDAAGSLHVCTLDYGNTLWHTLQLSSSTWQPFNDVRRVHLNDPGRIGDVAVAGIGTLLHVCVVADGKIWHTIRATSRWQAVWGDVMRVMNPASTETVTRVACAQLEDNLHVCALTEDGRIIHTIRMSAPPSWQNPEDSGRAFFGDVTAEVGRHGVDPRPFKLLAVSGQ
ncbi:hypothetical protein [Amycolatopsis alba]|uniref:WD40 repeat domain-containing protein n=1 Tax=Amycolatopsis alba DSM 44262 TaxID=1125972 RepID=A0A229RKC2_AMYAL|nr:hypothetical protein [Amycolatopsis alba]OXM47116.1 hypothetical protein CFP75_25185 [Amycolatopsis alba DSM 44262]